MSIIIHSRVTGFKHKVSKYSLDWPSNVDIQERISGKILDLIEGKVFKIEHDGDTKDFILKRITNKGSEDDEVVHFVALK